MIFFALIVVTAIIIWGWYSSTLVLKMTRLPVEVTPDNSGFDFEEENFAATDGTQLTGWFIPAEYKTSDSTIIICHGWGSNKGEVLDKSLFLCRSGGYNLFYFDFRNHGESKGEMSSLAAYETCDLEGAIAWLLTNKIKEAKWLGVLGFSMGGAVSLVVASSNKKIRAVAADSAYTTFNDVIFRFAWLFYHIPKYPLMPLTLLALRFRYGLNPNTFSPLFHIAKIAPRPVLLIQGEEDRRVPRSEGEMLFKMAGEPKEIWYAPLAHHAQAYNVDPLEYEKRVLNFFRKAREAVPL